MIHDFHGIVLGHLVIVRSDGLHFNYFYFFGGIAVVAEHKGSVFTHALLGNNHTLTTLDNEVSTQVFRAFTESARVKVLLVMKQTVFAANHDRNLAQVNIGE